MDKLFIGCFRFEESTDAYGSFQIAVKASTLLEAENTFKKTLLDLSNSTVFKNGSNVFLLDIIEINDAQSAVIYNLTKQYKNGGIVYKPLPVRSKNSTSYSTGQEEAKEPFFVF